MINNRKQDKYLSQIRFSYNELAIELTRSNLRFLTKIIKNTPFQIQSKTSVLWFVLLRYKAILNCLY